ncbi:MAG: hypothetical protein RM347_026255 [Nostoc sp. ChiQUE02]|uniref:hypothetical protein n=1 Tax=Nostoc sp. ChiQUE02 TaxID=3075377 RepID=UPI002AD47A55|nr:hypothetical protein [Nostoc sp. ChiQUE02]MDZ8234787.1 hypothetical protein [Nostoc sp. ChiQUE02]
MRTISVVRTSLGDDARSVRGTAWFDSLPYGTLRVACFPGGVRLRYLGSGSIKRLVLSVVEVSRDARHKSGQAA